MKIPTRKREQGLRFNVTPLIDIIFLLIIFFLAASHFVRSETAEAVELPSATQGKDEEDQRTSRLIVTITADLEFKVADESVELSVVEEMILRGREESKDAFELRIRADEAVPYAIVEPIMLAAARAGVVDVKFGVVPR